MTCIVLIRHGPTDWNEEHRLQGRADRSLSAEGRKKVSTWSVPDVYKDFHWVASPLRRAQQTAALLSLDIKQLEPAIIEMDWGDWDGHTRTELDEIYGDEISKRAALGLDLCPHNGESPRDLRERVGKWARGIGETGISTGAVCHQGIIRAALSLATDWNMVGRPPRKMDWASAHVFNAHEDGVFEITELNISLLQEDAG